ncbi:MAG TPA: protein kinase, partial [Kofleriaceae bacterium]|nr:protein kinase [Kofleriaceae bacterium]
MRLSGPEDMGADVAAEEPFGPYLVYERLGVGGMATVHRALERGIEGFERMVALKRLLPHLALDATFIKSFVREAKLASLLNHVNIVQIFELGRVGTQYFISMEYIDGRDIRRILRHARRISGPPPIHVTVGLLLQLCEALDYAHHKIDDSGHPMGLVHRDVSPSNVLVTSAGQVKVIDFGIAKAQSAQLRTQTGRVKGKLAYMAPEALAGKDLDARSDLFAAGVIAHELLTARPLFAAKNEYQTLMKVQRGEVMPPSTFNQACPPELDAIVLRTLARDPDDRFAGAGELRDALHALRKQYALQTSDRDIATWLDWAFQLEPPSEAANGVVSAPPAAELDARTRRPRTARPRRPDDDEAVELAWGGHDDHGDGEPVVLDDVPDVSAKHLQSASALGAEVRLDLDDLADDIPTPLPGHNRPLLDLAARTVTAPQLPRAIARSRAAAAARASQGVPAQHADGRSGRVVAPVAEPLPAPAPAVDDGATQIEISPIVPAVRSALVPSRPRTTTMPPRPLPAASVAPRPAAATLPPRVGPATNEPSRPVPLPAAPSRSGAVATDRSRSTAIPAVQSRTGPVATLSSTASGLETSHGVPLAIEPPYLRPGSAESSRSGPLPAPPARSNPTPIPPPRILPSASVAPRERRGTSPDSGTPPADVTAPPEPVISSRDTLVDLAATERNPVYTPDDLGLAADTMPAMPALDTAHTSVSVRFRLPSAPPPNATTPAAVVPPPANATLPVAALAAAPTAPPAGGPPAHDLATTS